MAMGSGYLAWLLLVFDAFLLPANPVGAPVSPNDIYRYIPIHSNVIVHVDIRSIKKQFDTSLVKLGQQPFVKQNPMMGMLYSRMNMMLNQGIASVERKFKVVKLNQIRFITLGLSFKKRFKDPSIMVVVRGELNEKVVQHLTTMRRGKYTRSTSHGITFYQTANKSRPQFGWTDSGQVLVMTPDVAKELHKSGPVSQYNKSLATRMISQYKNNHAVAFGMRTSPALRREFRRVPAIVRKLAEDMNGMYAAGWGGGSSVKVWGRNPTTVKRYAKILKGVAQFSVAGDHFRSGLLDLIDGVVDSGGAPVRNPILGSVMQFKPAIIAYLRGLFNKSPLSYTIKTDSISTQLTFKGNGGASVPMMGVFGGLGFFVSGRSAQKPMRPSYKRSRAYPRGTTPIPMPVAPRVDKKAPVKKDSAKAAPVKAAPKKAAPVKAAPASRPSK